MKVIKAEVNEETKQQVLNVIRKEGITEAKFVRDAVKDALKKSAPK